MSSFAVRPRPTPSWLCVFIGEPVVVFFSHVPPGVLVALAEAHFAPNSLADFVFGVVQKAFAATGAEVFGDALGVKIGKYCGLRTTRRRGMECGILNRSKQR